MEALLLLIPLALIFCLIAIKAFFWAVSHRQFDNLDSAARSILFDDENISGDSAATSPLNTRNAATGDINAGIDRRGHDHDR